ncbi:MAG: response regulator [Candidatus Desulfatibia sp.]|uniref:response regulator n=1 Tax=Candidatus Desulfatibia sp. TaxID=3101189 RepID=UPI002F326888
MEAFRAAPDKFDLVITDMTMPNMTGIQFSQKLLEIRPDIPIIICTGFSAKVDGEKAKAFGIRGYVMKPVVMSEIAKKIREVLDQD